MIKVLKTGLYDTIQDMGRWDFQEYGVPVSGVMDRYSAKIANALVGNEDHAALLEITLIGPKLEFLQDCLISITGADLSPSLNGISIPLNTTIHIKRGDILSFGKRKQGCRAYLAVSGGFLTQTVMKSRSMYKNITNAFKIEKGEILPSASFTFNERTNANASVKVKSEHFAGLSLDVCKGPEFDLLSNEQQDRLLSSGFSIANENSRMAYQLEETLQNQLEPIITSLVLPGTVQLTPSGKLIVLMRDCQTTGGYPRVLQLSVLAINRLSQKFTGDLIHFKLKNM
ncbi:biotin-dependent carboxyltransferase family protein [Pontimicrobium sp. IMCC45349]|uniref:5-oxoprolinase subunit C family protein n=1 Tax=Pontimicrobium sp. IMCC45349 TaxID=3391574 RepID=UPI0039A3AE74